MTCGHVVATKSIALNRMNVEYLTRVREVRAYLAADDDHWACERCGQTSEEGLAVVQTARRTRADPASKKCFMLCGWCMENKTAGYSVPLYGGIVND